MAFLIQIFLFLEPFALDLCEFSRDILYFTVYFIKCNLLNRFLTLGRGRARDIDYRDISHRITYIVSGARYLHAYIYKVFLNYRANVIQR